MRGAAAEAERGAAWGHAWSSRQLQTRHDIQGYIVFILHQSGAVSTVAIPAIGAIITLTLAD
jgi:hypothetical protein